MTFRVLARTVLHLGRELISSDAVAFYEIVKNAFDAGSPKIGIQVVRRIEHSKYVELSDQVRKAVAAADGKRLDSLRNDVMSAIPLAIYRAKELRDKIVSVESLEQLLEALDDANFIAFEDTGSGMSLSGLDDNFLTIGTRSRQQEINSTRIVLGEKGLGRLSVMRLGDKLRVRTSERGDTHWNILKVDWRKFSHDSDETFEDVPVDPERGPQKESPTEHGTVLTVSALAADWSTAKLETVAISELSRLTDPFTSANQYRVELSFNGSPVAIPKLDKLLFKEAHAIVRADFDPNVESDDAALTGSINYVLRGREKQVSLNLAHLASVTKQSVEVLRAVGPFAVVVYWFNRQALRAVDGIGDKAVVKDLVNRWSGGVMVFRDGFRVHPYGNPDDDWLSLDRKALASGGYKVNRKQVIGKLDISRRSNPSLKDQANRQGIRDSDEKDALIALLKNLLENQFRAFLNKVDKEKKVSLALSFDELDERLEQEGSALRLAVEALAKTAPKTKENRALVDELLAAVAQMEQFLSDARDVAESFERGKDEVLNLAGLGLMVEIVAHELNRSATHAVRTLEDTDTADLPADVARQLRTLGSQLKTLQKRLRILDPLSTSGRQQKERFEIVAWVREILSSHDAQFLRHHVAVTLATVPPNSAMHVRMVKGMVVQVLENLITNSVYWLKQQRKIKSKSRIAIDVVIDTRTRRILFSDSGPGIARDNKDDIFEPFFTTKPPGEGKGLGLFVSREIARYHDGDLTLLNEAEEETLRTFVFQLPSEESK